MAQKYWFKRRRYGYGWTPSAWQGWLILAVFLAGIALLVVWFVGLGDMVSTTQIVYYLAGIVVLTVGLVSIAYAKGPKPKWRWGKRQTDKADEDY